MRILAVETSTLAGGAALLDGDRLLGEYTVNIRTTHSERLMTAMDHLLHDCGWEPGDLEGMAVSIGPGSFTGLRIGVSAVKGLALALGIPVAAVPTLDALAATLPFAADPVCPVLDAKKGEVYASLYHWAEGTMLRDWEYLALPPEALCDRLEGPVIFVGDAVDTLGGLLAARLGGKARFTPAGRRLPSPACVGALGHAFLLAGRTVDAAALTPLYLRPSEAELRRRRAVLVP
ncbi:MAG: tRNA (adenosine(37)-N6)-threonylcarbamoyltransferase complex dimerization subunit type 1 TsaB [Candidatus Rokubacteria bacterium]|nr:tRNA (adenosine(37)-N6)-threonylcarbamoyltransferase complex dimerization subunit type 1 TsaB [Candidatus Rokubacteria bacterium]